MSGNWRSSDNNSGNWRTSAMEEVDLPHPPRRIAVHPFENAAHQKRCLTCGKVISPTPTGKRPTQSYCSMKCHPKPNKDGA